MEGNTLLYTRYVYESAAVEGQYSFFVKLSYGVVKKFRTGLSSICLSWGCKRDYNKETGPPTCSSSLQKQPSGCRPIPGSERLLWTRSGPLAGSRAFPHGQEGQANLPASSRSQNPEKQSFVCRIPSFSVAYECLCCKACSLHALCL